MFEERFIQLVEENGGFEFYQAYRGDVDLILGGKGNTFWYVVMKKGKVTESYIGKNAGGVWEDVYVKGSGWHYNEYWNAAPLGSLGQDADGKYHFSTWDVPPKNIL